MTALERLNSWADRTCPHYEGVIGACMTMDECDKCMSADIDAHLDAVLAELEAFVREHVNRDDVLDEIRRLRASRET